MTIRNLLFASVIALSAAAAAPVLAQAAPAAAGTITAGAQVLDAQGAAVGTVQSVEGGNVVLKTDKYQAAFPATSFTKTDKGYLFGMTQAEVNAAVEQAQAQAAQTMVVGATVKGSAGAPVGTIEAIDAEFVTLKLTSGKSVRLARAAVAATPDGPIIGVTAAELETQAAAATGQ